MGRKRAEPTSDKRTTMRARVRTLLARRKRFWLDVTFFVVVSAAMIVATIANRDSQASRALLREGEAIASALQAYLAEHGQPPLLMPHVPGRDAQHLARQYYFNIFYPQQARGARPAGVCVAREARRFYFRPAGRVMVLFDGEEFAAEFITEAELQVRADALGFGKLLEQ